MPKGEGTHRINSRGTAEELFDFAFRHSSLKLSPVHLVRCARGGRTSLAQLFFKSVHSALKDSDGKFQSLHRRLNTRLSADYLRSREK